MLTTLFVANIDPGDRAAVAPAERRDAERNGDTGRRRNRQGADGGPAAALIGCWRGSTGADGALITVFRSRRRISAT